MHRYLKNYLDKIIDNMLKMYIDNKVDDKSIFLSNNSRWKNRFYLDKNK